MKQARRWDANEVVTHWGQLFRGLVLQRLDVSASGWIDIVRHFRDGFHQAEQESQDYPTTNAVSPGLIQRRHRQFQA